MSSELATAPVNPGFHKATSALSTTLGIEPRMMIETLKKQCFPSMRSEDISDAQLAAFVSVANTLELNPLIPGMLYGYPTKSGGILPLSGPDAILKKLDEGIEKAKLDGYDCTVFPEAPGDKPTHAVARIWRKGSERPAVFTAVFSEWVVSSNPNWTMRPRHMLWLRALKQCARQVIHGVPLDRDDMEVSDMVNVTPPTPETQPEPVVQRAAAPARAKKGAAAVVENVTPPAADKKSTVVEGEFTDAPKATVAVEPKTEKVVTPAVVEATTAPVVEATPELTKPTPRAFLKDGEAVTCVCTVKSVSTLTVKQGDVLTPSVQAEVTGDFNGPVLHIGGATAAGEVLTPLPVWTVGKKVTANLIGKLSKNSGKVLARVEKVEASQDNAAMEVD